MGWDLWGANQISGATLNHPIGYAPAQGVVRLKYMTKTSQLR